MNSLHDIPGPPSRGIGAPVVMPSAIEFISVLAGRGIECVPLTVKFHRVPVGNASELASLPAWPGT